MPSAIYLFLFWYLFLCSKEKSTSTIFFLYNTAYSIVATFVTPLVSVIRYICIIFKVKKRGVRGFSPCRHILFQNRHLLFGAYGYGHEKTDGMQ